jgi:indole-3-glycerol phosphate synthase
VKFSLEDMRNLKAGEIPEMKLLINKIKKRKRSLHGMTGSLDDRINIIAELKHSSPSSGILSGDLSSGDIVKAYIKGGASAISVLTEKIFFGGSYPLLQEVCSSCDKPVLCKDFIFFSEQIEAAYLCGADSVLLISKVLGKGELKKLYDEVKSYGMEPLVEIHEKSEIDSISSLNPELVLVNMRNLGNLEIDFSTGIETLQALPFSAVPVSASGINTQDDMLRIKKESGTVNFLIGSSLMKSKDPAGMIMELKNVC